MLKPGGGEIVEDLDKFHLNPKIRISALVLDVHEFI
jgi:hypothetical protein